MPPDGSVSRLLARLRADPALDDAPIAWGDFRGQMPSGMAAPGWSMTDPRYHAWYAQYTGPDKAALPPPRSRQKAK